VKDIVNPYCFVVRDKFLKQFRNVNYNEIHIDRWFDGNRLRATGTIEKGFKIANKKYGNKYVSGIRADESGIRKIVMKLYGYQTKNTCRPLGWWKEKDVFAYLNHYKLPIHSNYAMLGGGRYKREYLRVASIGIKRGDNFDKNLWEREYYSDILHKLQ
jgi:phosphoadenosine phosphosulfate reductase